MASRVIPLSDHRLRSSAPMSSSVPRVPPLDHAPVGLLRDTLGRPLRDLRISVTDRCNFRCGYCMPKEVFDGDYEFLPHASLLSFEEITRLARVFVAQGVQKIRLTGGEPLLRRHIERLIEMLAVLHTPEGLPLDITLTTNGSLLKRKAQSLKDAGLQRITVSLDGLDDAVFQRMNDVGFAVAEVLDGIAAAQAAGLAPIKVNMVVKRGSNEGQIVPMARHFHGSGVRLRFIEYMDVGATNGWRMDEVLPSDQVLAQLRQHFELLPLGAAAPGETAERWAYADGGGEVGLISSVTQAFCGDCNRARLSTEGKLFMCLFGHHGHDLRALLRTADAACSDAQLAGVLAQLWASRDDRYSQLRADRSDDAGEVRRVEMHYIGG